MSNKDGSVEDCFVFYYPITSNYRGDIVYDDPRAVVQIPTKTGWDFREIPSRFLNFNPNK